MNTRSIRFKLTTIYSSVLIISLGILLVSFSFLVTKEFYDHTDIVLRLHAEQLKSFVRAQGPQTPNIDTTALQTQSREAPGMLALILDSGGNVTFASQTLNKQIILNLRQLYTQSNKSTIINYPIGSQIFRFILTTADPQLSYSPLIIMGHPVDVIQNSLYSLYFRLFLIFVLLLFPTVFGAYLLAGKALNPLSVISLQMESLSSENLHSRISYPTSGDEIGKLTSAFNRLLDRMEKAFKRERQFLGDVAHELKTPLSTVKSSLEVSLTKPRTNEDYKKEMSHILSDVNGLSQTLNDLLTIAWSQTDASQNLLDPVSLSDIGRDLWEISKRLAESKHITIQAHIENGIFIRAKKDKLFRALLNIVDNAVKYSFPKGKISLTIKHDAASALVTIKDFGPGIPEPELPHIFDRFYRGSKVSKTHGTGLGLAISHGIITALGGQIRVSSRVGAGTSFHITLPLFTKSS